MAFWSKKEPEFSEMHEVVEEHPGITAAELARKLDVSLFTVQRRLPSMSDVGYLVYEDDKGGLWPFGWK